MIAVLLLLLTSVSVVSAQVHTIEETHGVSLAFSPDGATLASSGELGITLWDTDSWTEKKSFDIPCINVKFSPDGRSLICYSRVFLRGSSPASGPDGKIIEIGSGDWIGWRTYPMLAISPDAATAIIGNPNNIFLVDSETYEETLATISKATDGPFFSAVWMHPDNRRIFVGTTDDNINIWNRDGELEGNLWGSNAAEVSIISGSPDGSIVASINANMKLKAWDANDYRILAYENRPVRSMAFSYDSRILAVGLAETGQVELLATATWNTVSVFEYTDSDSYVFGVEALAMSPDGRTLASTPYGNSSISIWKYNAIDIPTAAKPSTWGAIKKERRE